VINYSAPSSEIGWGLRPQPYPNDAQNIHNLYGKLIKVAYGDLDYYPVVYNPDLLTQLSELSKTLIDRYLARKRNDEEMIFLEDLIIFRNYRSTTRHYMSTKYQALRLHHYSDKNIRHYSVQPGFDLKIPHTPLLVRIADYLLPHEIIESYTMLFETYVFQLFHGQGRKSTNVLPFLPGDYFSLYENINSKHIPLLYVLSIYGTLWAFSQKRYMIEWMAKLTNSIRTMIRSSGPALDSYVKVIVPILKKVVQGSDVKLLGNIKSRLIGHYLMLYYYPKLLVWLTAQKEFYLDLRNKEDYYLPESVLETLIDRFKAGAGKSVARTAALSQPAS
jgi:hypothetical protein